MIEMAACQYGWYRGYYFDLIIRPGIQETVFRDFFYYMGKFSAKDDAGNSQGTRCCIAEAETGGEKIENRKYLQRHYSERNG